LRMCNESPAGESAPAHGMGLGPSGALAQI